VGIVSAAHVIGAVACASALMTGCASQIDGLAPVGGDARAGVATAATNVLLERKFGILQVPICTEAGDVVSCVGSLTDGQVISVRADVGATPYLMTLTVGGAVVYEGGVQAVLDDAARATEEADES
jgi:outer membrane murein-binding lipoprotein Lpp